MLTFETLKLYGRRWGICCSANGWRSVAGQVACDEATNAARSDLHADVWRLAHIHAGAKPVTVDDLRRAVTAVAVGHFASVRDISNRDFSRLLCLVGSGPRQGKPEKRGLLIDPDDLVSMRYWLDPELEEMEQITWYIEHCPAPYVKRIAADKFGVADWQSLGRADLRKLWFTLKERNKAHRRSAAGSSPG